MPIGSLFVHIETEYLSLCVVASYSFAFLHMTHSDPSLTSASKHA
jgi:hypothetical protein